MKRFALAERAAMIHHMHWKKNTAIVNLYLTYNNLPAS